MKRYRPRITANVTAIQWTGDNLRAVQDFLFPESPLTQGGGRIGIRIKAGLDFLNIGGWVVRGIDGVFFCTEEEFSRRFVEIEEDQP